MLSPPVVEVQGGWDVWDMSKIELSYASLAPKHFKQNKEGGKDAVKA